MSGPVSSPVATATLWIPDRKDLNVSWISPPPVLRRLMPCWRSASILTAAAPSATSAAPASTAPPTASPASFAPALSVAAPTLTSLAMDVSAPSIATSPMSCAAEIANELTPFYDLCCLTLCCHGDECLVNPPDALLHEFPRWHTVVPCRHDERIPLRIRPGLRLAFQRQVAPQID